MAGRRIVIEFLGKDVSAGKTADQVEGKFGKLSSRFQRAGDVAGKLLAGGLVAGGAAMVKFGKQASDLGEAQSKANVVFGDSVGVVNDFAKNAARTAGLSKSAALEAQGTIGNLLLSMGKVPGEAATMSSQMVQLAADIGSFNNVEVDEVLSAMRSGLTGEIAPLRRFGVNLTDATLKAKAMQLGLYDGKGALDVSAKSTAAYQLILEQTKTAQGDFARTSDGLANKQRIMKAEWENITTQLGTKALPVMVKVTDWATKAIDWMERHSTLVKVLAGVIGGLVTAVWAINKAARAWTAVQAALNIVMSANPIGLVVVAIAALVAGLVIAYKKSETFRKVVDGAFKAVGDAISFLWNKVAKPYFKFMINAWLNVAGWIVKGAARAFGWIPGIGPKLKAAADKFEAFKDSVNRKLDGVKPAEIQVKDKDARRKVNAFKDFYMTQIGKMNNANVHVGAAPGTPVGRRAFGGPVRAGRAYLVGERRPEMFVPSTSGRIVPRVAGRGGGDTHIHIHGVTDKQGAAREVRKVLLDLKRTVGPLGLA